MQPIGCALTTQSTVPHLQQIFTGFSVLARAGMVELSERFGRYADLTNQWVLAVQVNGRLAIYDVDDTHDIDLAFLERADFYFKRSFDASYVSALGPLSRRVRPLGLNYEVLPDHQDFAGARRNFCLRQGLRRFSGVLSALNAMGRFVPRQALLECAKDGPDPSEKILFLTRAWDPDDRPDRPTVHRQRRDDVNEMRASCIVEMRNHFGGHVLAGFSRTDYAASRFPTLLAPDSVTNKRSYLTAVRNAAVCVTTAGLHDSIGWKLGEYVALGKAIVSERLPHSLPGNFPEGMHYLPFASSDECVAAVDLLLSDTTRRRGMQAENRSYYHRYLRPDRLVLNTLEVVVGHGLTADSIAPQAG